ncbi:DUF4422 domain-containing protein [Campylobacter jejuni]|nr:DUF4422 domain-containing protein [Campylobacter jejuni]
MKENEKKIKPSIKILVGYHKPAELLKDDILTPIHLGRALTTEVSKDGNISKDDYKWMCENMIGDDTGDNISYLNRYLNELTGIYWAWKNYDKLGNPDYIGYVHYRRLFLFDERDIYLFKNNDNWSYIIDDFYKYKNFFSIQPYIFNYDLIIPNKFFFNKTNDNIKYSNIKDFMLSWNGNYSSSYNLFLFLLKQKGLDKLFYESVSNCSYYPCNMFIMRKDIFFDYCSFLFNFVFCIYDILGEDISKRQNLWGKREIAWVSEYITSLFIYQMNEKKIKELNVVMIKNDSSSGAVDRIKNQLSYKIGNKIIKSKNPFDFIILPFSILLLVYRHKRFISINKFLTSINNHSLKTLPLEQYSDYKEAIKIKNQLSYKIGNCIIKHPFTFLFRLNKVYKEWKYERK